MTYLSLVLLGAGLTWGGTRIAARTIDPPSRATATQTSPASKPQSPNPLPAKASGIVPTNFVTDAVDRVGPAVVRIDTQRSVSNPVAQQFNDPLFRQFFGDRVPQMPDRQVQSGTGSGFIIDANGEIVTNAHVVDGADKVTVTLKDGRSFEGKVVGRDAVTDVAVVHIEAENLPAVSLGDSDRLKPGEWAIAIGNPLGLDNTVTTGIISATGRSSSQVGVPDKRVDFIQTDAAINPGNSGGPLLNQNGEAIGMNTAIIQGAQGLGFAIPIETVRDIARQLVANGKVEHPYLGIQMVGLTPEIKANLNNNPNSGISVTEEQGVLIVRVVADSPADRAGLRTGDVLQKINGKTVSQADEVQAIVNEIQVGDSVTLELRRDGKTLDLEVKTGMLPVMGNG
ncbi:MAG TPA: trypsin-like peptidase domain-containing protein [Oscillatoriales cyanobacterium M59_W2019_021]|nr:trypsin-like peptidase domain-containing protein [Oscillatoriales cyanobacterium M4454_W2019_049]HIK49580.1 trypsin-like peptidase domain-containing protein [Oscillatoriales cyanobacterium M59_W2019_021]